MPALTIGWTNASRSEEHTSELQSRRDLVCRLLLEKKKTVPAQRRRKRYTRLRHVPHDSASSMSTTTSSPLNSPPVRAITSPLSTRTAPPVPPASQTYEPLARAVLRRRLLYDILPLSILPVWTSAICWRMWNASGMSESGILNTLIMPIHPSTLLMTTVVWLFGVLPLIILR